MTDQFTILFLAANSGMETLRRAGEEAREIGRRLLDGPQGRSFKFVIEPNVRARDLSLLLQRHRPHVLHLSGRGEKATGILLADGNESPRPVDNQALTKLFEILNERLRVVVFNACYTKQRARGLSKFIDYTIGMTDALDDDSAVNFSESFYQTLGFGRTVVEAFGVACASVGLTNPRDARRPYILWRDGVDISLPLFRPDAAFDLGLVDESSRRARKGLEPAIIPRIARPVVREKYLPAIERGVTAAMQRVIPIVGPAGYGKSTILGEIYDELAARAGWVALVRCNELQTEALGASVESFSLALGYSMAGEPKQVAEIAADLTEARGRGVLLIDTLDIVLNERVVPALRGLLLQLLGRDCTVVFTCRDHEYEAFLEPAREKLGGVVESIDRYNLALPSFTPEEVTDAARGFIRARQIRSPDGGLAFARSILSLSADNRPLPEIVSNPLLLALLCELYGRDGAVPRDLTVSKLYEQYWEAKITRGRKHGPHSPEALLKRRMCLGLARAAFEMSSERLREWVAESDLELEADDAASRALADLFSEGVLKRRPGGQVHFFHQTFLEYAIARWLATRAGEDARARILDSLQHGAHTYSRLYWWPVVRQVLTIADPDDFDRFVGRLDLTKLPAFRAVVYAVVSREDGATKLRRLSPRAVEMGDAYQEILREAVEASAAPLAEAAWEAAVDLMARGNWRTAVKSAQTAGALAARHGRVVGGRFTEALSVAARRPAEGKAAEAERGDYTILAGWLLKSLLDAAGDDIEPGILRSLRERYPSLHDSLREKVVRLHLLARVPEAERVMLLRTCIPEPAAAQLLGCLTALLEQLLPTLVASGEPPWGSSLTEALHATLPEQWDKVQAKAVGRHLPGDERLWRLVLHDLFMGDGTRIYRNRLAVAEALDWGASEEFLRALVDIPAESIPAPRMSMLGGLLRDHASELDPAAQERVVRWLSPLLREHADTLIPVIVAVGNSSPAVSGLLGQLIREMPAELNPKYIRRILRDATAASVPVIAGVLGHRLTSGTLSPSARLALVEFHAILARDSPAALSELIAMSVGGGVRVGRAASLAIARLAREVEVMEPSSLLPLSTSKVVGVRLHWLETLTALLERGLPVAEHDLLNAFSALKDEDAEPVLQALCTLFVGWIRLGGRPGDSLGTAFANLAMRLLREDHVGVGTLRAYLVAFKVIAQGEEPWLIAQARGWVRSLLRSIDLQRINDGEAEVTDLLSAVARVDQDFLPALLTEDGPKLCERNVRAVVWAVKRVEGLNSQLLDLLLGSDWCALEVKSLILSLRGA
jgi:hypothetical protein